MPNPFGGAYQSPLVSVIVPVYNGENHLKRCLDSIVNQTTQDFELIIVDDGSTDSSPRILESYRQRFPFVRLVSQGNKGQGAARNRAMEMAKGTYVLFVDADDYVDRVTIEMALSRAQQDGSDFVRFDWKRLSAGDSQVPHYTNMEHFWGKRELHGVECDELLLTDNYFAVTSLYRRSFLEEHEIRFGLSRAYEDNTFVVQAINKAQHVSLLHAPLYTVVERGGSTTRGHLSGETHAQEHLRAVQESFNLLAERTAHTAFFLANYHVRKLASYCSSRIPRPLRRSYVANMLEILHKVDLSGQTPSALSPLMKLALRLRVFERRRAGLLHLIIGMQNFAMPKMRSLQRWLRRTKSEQAPNGSLSRSVRAALTGPIEGSAITFLGFDSNYSGNSRFLFEELLDDPRFSGRRLRFVTDDQRVPEEFRLAPGAGATKAQIARSRVVVAESWTSDQFQKHAESIWVQLWHGDPIKRLLFDSHEPHIFANRPAHKNTKYADIQRWDHLVVSSPPMGRKFETAFLADPERYLYCSYPRVEFLQRECDRGAIRIRVRQSLGLDPTDNKKIVLYAPTWRDSQYGLATIERRPNDYLDARQLAESLGEDVFVAVRQHQYLPSPVDADHPRVVDWTKADAQEVLLAADLVISDYSSIIFDARSIGCPVVLFVPDLGEYELGRGIYREAWEDLGSWLAAPAAASFSELVEAVCKLGPDWRVAKPCSQEPLSRDVLGDLFVGLTVEDGQRPSAADADSPVRGSSMCNRRAL